MKTTIASLLAATALAYGQPNKGPLPPTDEITIPTSGRGILQPSGNEPAQQNSIPIYATTPLYWQVYDSTSWTEIDSGYFDTTGLLEIPVPNTDPHAGRNVPGTWDCYLGNLPDPANSNWNDSTVNIYNYGPATDPPRFEFYKNTASGFTQDWTQLGWIWKDGSNTLTPQAQVRALASPSQPTNTVTNSPTGIAALVTASFDQGANSGLAILGFILILSGCLLALLQYRRQRRA